MSSEPNCERCGKYPTYSTTAVCGPCHAAEVEKWREIVRGLVDNAYGPDDTMFDRIVKDARAALGEDA